MHPVSHRLRVSRGGWCAIRFAACMWMRHSPFPCAKEINCCIFVPWPVAMRMLLVPKSLQQAAEKLCNRRWIQGQMHKRVPKLNQTDERTDANGHGRKAHNPR